MQVLKDDLIGPLLRHLDSGHPGYVAIRLGEVFGGPNRCTEERGGYVHMLSMHLGEAITEPQRRRWVSLFMEVADEVELPGDPEFRRRSPAVSSGAPDRRCATRSRTPSR
ncbi:hypothetical protein MTP10_29090 [Nonomuraea sp. 3-1Str]|uniref:hypothetical protein n=1 Tax=Nonomuraea sp. 3-1Str TaxID=2929801 RepID=UPI0028638C7E|nr:hypothetical protein [Nonomuraea sp. 3-1Str]MDR8412773.1 hypothetical protein [Nonomuraea sp. 3-1Str]